MQWSDILPVCLTILIHYVKRLKQSQFKDAFQDQHLSHATQKYKFLRVRPITNKRT